MREHGSANGFHHTSSPGDIPFADSCHEPARTRTGNAHGRADHLLDGNEASERFSRLGADPHWLHSDHLHSEPAGWWWLAAHTHTERTSVDCGPVLPPPAGRGRLRGHRTDRFRPTADHRRQREEQQVAGERERRSHDHWLRASPSGRLCGDEPRGRACFSAEHALRRLIRDTTSPVLDRLSVDPASRSRRWRRPRSRRLRKVR